MCITNKTEVENRSNCIPRELIIISSYVHQTVRYPVPLDHKVKPGKIKKIYIDIICGPKRLLRKVC